MVKTNGQFTNKTLNLKDCDTVPNSIFVSNNQYEFDNNDYRCLDLS